MPGNKRWHFEAQDEAVFIFRDGKEVFHSRKEQPLGPVKEIFYGAEHSQAKSFKAQAIEVSAHGHMYAAASYSYVHMHASIRICYLTVRA